MFRVYVFLYAFDALSTRGISSRYGVIVSRYRGADLSPLLARLGT